MTQLRNIKKEDSSDLCASQLRKSRRQNDELARSSESLKVKLLQKKYDGEFRFTGELKQRLKLVKDRAAREQKVVRELKSQVK